LTANDSILQRINELQTVVAKRVIWERGLALFVAHVQLLQELIAGAAETDEKMAMDLAGPGYHINRSNLLVLESKADMQKHGQASPHDGDALALTFAQAVAAPAKEEERDEDDEFGGQGHRRFNGPGAWMR
jgi:hypothetical protein